MNNKDTRELSAELVLKFADDVARINSLNDRFVRHTDKWDREVGELKENQHSNKEELLKYIQDNKLELLTHIQRVELNTVKDSTQTKIKVAGLAATVSGIVTLLVLFFSKVFNK